MLVELFQGVDIPCTGEDFAGCDCQEVGTTVPLLPLLVPIVSLAATDHRLQLQLPEQAQDASPRLILRDLAVVDLDVNGLVTGAIQDQWFVYHRLIPVEHGEDHVEMNKRFR